MNKIVSDIIAFGFIIAGLVMVYLRFIAGKSLIEVFLFAPAIMWIIAFSIFYKSSKGKK